MNDEVSTPNDAFDKNNVPKSETLIDLIDNLHRTFANDSINKDFVVKLLENYESNLTDWSKYVNYDQQKYIGFSKKNSICFIYFFY
jgi:hypothetical protein